MILEKLKQTDENYSYIFTIHALERCVERNNSPEDIRKAILSGEIIEEYTEDKYVHSCLILGTVEEMVNVPVLEYL